jgi:hypothetical protein
LKNKKRKEKKRTEKKERIYFFKMTTSTILLKIKNPSRPNETPTIEARLANSVLDVKRQLQTVSFKFDHHQPAMLRPLSPRFPLTSFAGVPWQSAAERYQNHLCRSIVARRFNT